MGQQLEKIFQIVTQKAGLDARMKMATKTGISKKQAVDIADTEEIVGKFKMLASELIGEDIEKFL
jgi:hypothetical protein